ncbi:MAG: hypothetical protein RLZZ592_91 [Pseudomonadota bacterium]|jgi:N-acetylglucosaminyldiphosphoundecaprenol N-acetyl-beta-D-mannosaminyltransferase
MSGASELPALVVHEERLREPVIGAPIDVLSWDQACERIGHWAAHRESRYVCICNVHSVVTARQEPGFHQVIAQADLATADGAPVAWMLRRLGHADQRRINGPDLMLRYFALAEQRQEPVFLYGNTPETLERLRQRLAQRLPGLRIAGMHSPPFRPLTPEEDQAVVDLINASGAPTVWVSLGCPKQERWMAEHRHRIRAVMVGVGAAFDYHAGVLERAPAWMQNAGLEWLHRLAADPRRLGSRYLSTNTRFIALAAQQLLGRRRVTRDDRTPGTPPA